IGPCVIWGETIRFRSSNTIMFHCSFLALKCLVLVCCVVLISTTFNRWRKLSLPGNTPCVMEELSISHGRMRWQAESRGGSLNSKSRIDNRSESSHAQPRVSHRKIRVHHGVSSGPSGLSKLSLLI